MIKNSSILDGTLLAEIVNYEGGLLPVTEKIPKLTEKNDLGVMTELEKRIYTLYAQRINYINALVKEVLGEDYEQIPDYANVFWEEADEQDEMDYNSLVDESKFFWETMWDLIMLRIPEQEEMFSVYLFPNYRIVSGINAMVTNSPGSLVADLSFFLEN